MCFLIGGLRFREQVSRPIFDGSPLLISPDLQQYCHPNECMSTQFECDESAPSRMYSAPNILFIANVTDRFPCFIQHGETDIRSS
jgi:hypothetical protein